MIEIRKSADRGHANHGWLDSHHTFSFADYFDPEHMHFRELRVINEDHVSPGQGFGRHPHRDMEIVTYVLSGALEHKDSIGNGSVLRHGDVQRMSAGTGIMHSEFNHSKTDPVHLLQIWILPAKEGIDPGYEEKRFPVAEERNRPWKIVSPDGSDGSLRIHQDASVHAIVLDPGKTAEIPLAPGRHAWVQVAHGSLAVNGKTLGAGDGAAISDEARVALEAKAASEALIFDLP